MFLLLYVKTWAAQTSEIDTMKNLVLLIFANCSTCDYLNRLIDWNRPLGHDYSYLSLTFYPEQNIFLCAILNALQQKIYSKAKFKALATRVLPDSS